MAEGCAERRAPPAGEAAPSRPPNKWRADGLRRPYETWSDPRGGEIDTACIVTTAANRLVGPLHDRMPAILESDAFAAWLDADRVDPAPALALVKPTPEEALKLLEVGPAVNCAANDDECLQRPVAAPIRSEFVIPKPPNGFGPHRPTSF